MATKEELLEKLSTTKLEKLAKKGEVLDDAKSSALALWSYRSALIEYIRRSRKVTIADIEAILEPKKKAPKETANKSPQPERSRRKVGKQEWELKKREYNYRCAICGKSEEEVGILARAHIQAYSKGGTQLFPLCPNCHTRYDKGILKDSELKKIKLTRAEYNKIIPRK